MVVCELILNDEFKDYPESALYMIGTVNEVKQKTTSGKPTSNDTSKLTPKTEQRDELKPAVTSETENAVDTHES